MMFPLRLTKIVQKKLRNHLFKKASRLLGSYSVHRRCNAILCWKKFRSRILIIFYETTFSTTLLVQKFALSNIQLKHQSTMLQTA